MQCATLIELLQLRAEHQAEKRAYTFMIDGKVEGKTFTYAELDLQARAIAAQLQQYHACGERALLLYPQGLEFLAAFFGCLYAGVIAIPAPPPEASRLKRTLPRLQAIAKDAQAKFTLTTESILALVEQHRQQIPEFKAMHWLTTENIQTDLASDWQRPVVQTDNLAYLQYTSGSTSTPKGVMISHHNILYHSENIRVAWKYDEAQSAITWMPYFHDYGLVDGIVLPLFANIPSYIMSPLAFIKRPFYWLNNISKYQITHTQAPNFAYQYCVDKLKNNDIEQLDLTSLVVASNGAEPIHKKTIEQFNKKFTPCGFKKKAFYSAYGLAEATLLISTVSTQNILFQDSIVSCGKPIGKTKLLIVNPETQTICQTGEVGEIWTASDSVAQGYWQNEQATKETFQAYTSDTNEGPFLRTGDLGFLYQDELFVTGRLKDLIIINGVNYYPQDIEWTLEQSHDLIRNSQSAVFSIVIDNEEQLVILAELEKKSDDTQTIIQAIRKIIFEYHELQAHAVVLLKKGSVLKTSSGKIQRHACKKAFLNSEFDEIVRDILSDSTSNIFVAPQSTTEIQITQIWATVLHIPFEQISIQDSFFKYGGQSLLAVEIINQINQHFNILLTAYSLFEYTTVEKLATHIEPLATQQYIAIPHIKQKHYPLSYMQQQIWLACNQVLDIAIYNEPLFIHFNTAIDPIVLEQSIQFIIHRHTILQSVFKVKQGVPIQKLKEHKQCSLQIVDLQHLPANDKETEYQNLAHTFISKPFDLEKDMLLRASLFQFGTEKNILLLVAHHLIVDGLSVYQTFLQELHTCYQSFIDNKQPNLPALSIQYSDYAHWQRSTPIPAIQIDYWQKKLANIEVLQLPTDFSYPAKNTYQGATHCFNLSKQTTAKLKKLGKEQNTTLFMNLLTVFYVLLYRYTGQNDIVVSTVINQRNRPELENLIGLFLNTLLLRTVFKDEISFLELLQEAKKVALEAYAHQNMPFTEVLQNLRATQNIDVNHLFQVAFVLEPAIMNVDENWSCSLLNIHTNAAKFDLTLQFEDKTDFLIGRFEYRTDLFKAATIERMAGHFQTLLDAALNQPETAIFKLPLLTAREQKQFAIWNDTQADFPQDKCIHQLFEAQVERVPNNVALIFGQQQLTYLELNQKANQLAHHLIALGVQPETLVGICIDRSLEMVIGLLAVLKAGGAYVPLDPNYPQERLNFMIDDAKIKILLTQEGVLPKLAITENTIVLTIENWHCIDGYSNDNPKTNVKPENLAYVIYTSGSTGKPKGVLLEHKGLNNLAIAQIDQFFISETSRVLQFSSISFDAAASEIFSTVLVGASLVLSAQNNILVGRNLCQMLIEQNISVVTIPPSIIATIHEEQPFSRLKTLIVAGESCPINLVNYWIKKDINFINAYGPTEVTVCTTISQCQTNIETSPPIGYPIANTKLYVLDKNQQQIPVGLTGELYIGGVGVARGYLNRPKLTAEKFIINPLTKDKNDRLYRTGDLVRFLEDGQLEFVGRIDHQVKIRGFRIELEEIESILKQHDNVQDAIVTIEQNEKNHTKRIAAYIVPTSTTRRISLKTVCQVQFDNNPPMALSTENLSCHGIGLIGLPISSNCREQQALTLQFSLPDIDKSFSLTGHVVWIKGHRMGISFDSAGEELCQYIEEKLQSKQQDELHRNSASLLRQYLSNKLPHYMIPSIFILLDKMPLTPNGKVDRHALTQQTNATRLDLQVSHTEPQSDMEQTIAEIWKQVLQLEKVGIYESFFDLGGDSLEIVKVQKLLENKLQYEFPTAILFQYPSISVLAHYFVEQIASNEIVVKDAQQHQQRVLQRKKAHQRHKKYHTKKDS